MRVLISRAASALRPPGCPPPPRSRGPARAGARGFHRRVQRQDVGLKAIAVDGADDVGDRWLLSWMPLIVADHLATTSPPLTATCAARQLVGRLRALSAFWR